MQLLVLGLFCLGMIAASSLDWEVGSRRANSLLHTSLLLFGQASNSPEIPFGDGRETQKGSKRNHWLISPSLPSRRRMPNTYLSLYYYTCLLYTSPSPRDS